MGNVDMEKVREWVDRDPMVVPPSIESLAEQYRGDRIAIVGNGYSGHRDLSEIGLPLWTFNGGWVPHRTASLTFMMDDLMGPAWDSISTQGPNGNRIELSREEWEPLVVACPTPIITARAYPEKVPQTVEYPLDEVLSRFAGAEPYYAETVCYAVAWAIMIGVSEITFYGCDYERIRAAERACVEYWIGRAREAGIKINIAKGSQLLKTGPLDGKNRHHPQFYGYTDWCIPPDDAAAIAQITNPESGMPRGGEAMDALLAEKGIKRVLDVGCGAGDQAKYMADAGKQVVGIDLVCKPNSYDPLNGGRILTVKGDYLAEETIFAEQFDAIWCSHMLEHVFDPQAALRKMLGNLKDGGLLAITVPPAKHSIVGGHFTLWNAGLLLYHLVLAGFNCSQARVKQYDYNISVLVRKSELPSIAIPEDSNYPVALLKDFFPSGIDWEHGIFNGDIKNLNWS